jgi:type I restriction enzyme S subunit
MSFPPYEAYRDSGIEWLGDVPAHWQIKKLKRLASFCGGGTPDRENAAYWNGDIPWVSPKDMKAELISGAEELITEQGLKNSATSLIPANTILMVVRSGILKHTIPIAISTIPVALNQDMKALSFRLSECTPRFFLRWVQGLNDQLRLAWSKQGATVESIEHDYLAESFIVIPPVGEQKGIASFLDCETAKIDGLIAEQERLIALLNEKRQAVISHAVTTGLDPNPPMKDSGVEWLGKVPAQWRISRLKHLSSHVVDCLHTTPTYDGDLIHPAIRTADLERGRLLLSQARLVSEEVYQDRIQRLPPQAGDILYSREGERFGMAALVPKDTKLCLGQRMMMFRVYPCVDPAYVMWLLNSDAVYQQVMSTVGGATSPHVNIAEIINFAVPVPPLHEQADIAHKIEEAASGCDSLIEKSEEAISLLQERRSALISATVTGKIDVQGVSTAEAEAA